MKCKKCGSSNVLILFNTVECKVCDGSSLIKVALTNSMERTNIMMLLTALKFNTKYTIYSSNKTATYIARLSSNKTNYYGRLYNIELWDEELVGWEDCTDIQLVNITQLIDKLKKEV